MHVSLAAEYVFSLFGLPISNSIFTTWIVIAVLGVITFLIRRSLKPVPGKLQSFLELVYTYFLDTADSVIGNRAVARELFPFIMTLFLFITLSNWSDLLPGIGSIGIFHPGEVVDGVKVMTPFFRPPTSDINLVAAMAIVSIIYIQYLGIKYRGFAGHFKKFFNVSNPIMFFTGLLELFSEISRTISFTFRLFGNIFGGEVLLTVIFFLTIKLAPFIPIIPLPFYFLELFVGLIQAFVFCFLVIVFTSLAIQDHSGHTEALPVKS